MRSVFVAMRVREESCDEEMVVVGGRKDEGVE